MSLEQRIKELLESKAVTVQERATLPISNMDNGDKSPIKQGSSEDAPSKELVMGDMGNQGASAAEDMEPAGEQKSIVMKGDATSVKVQSMESVDAHDLKADISALFEGQEQLSEEFVTKATAIFEAAVVARVNAEVIAVKEQLDKAAAEELTELKDALSEQVDKYMDYVVESWMKENQVAVDAGLRTEIAESFMQGLKNLFVENYIEVPEDKVDIIEDLSTKLDETNSKLNESVATSLELKAQIAKLERQSVLESASKGMTATDAERLTQLVEGVEFDSKELFAEKVSVVKEAHFKSPAKKSAETLLAESTGEGNNEVEVSPTVQRYVAALTRKNKF